MLVFARPSSGTAFGSAVLIVMLLAGTADAAARTSWASDVMTHAPSTDGEGVSDIAILPNGTVFVVMNRYTGGGSYDVTAQIIDSSGARLYSPDLRVNRVTPGNHQSPSVAVDGAGNAVVVWSQNELGVYKIRGQMIAPNGTLMWGPGDKQLDQNGGISHIIPTVATNGNGKWVVVWSAQFGSWMDIIAMEVNNTGDPTWGTVNKPVNRVTTNNQNFATAVRNASGHTIVVWWDDRDGVGGYDAFAQALNESGAPGWGATDMPVNQVADQVGSRITLAAAGDQYYVAWSQYRAAFGQIFGQKLSYNGTPMWGPSDRMLLGDGLKDVFGPSLALDTTARADDAGELFVSYSDCPDDICDRTNISLMRFDSAGNALWGLPVRVNQDSSRGAYEAIAAFNPVDSHLYVGWTQQAIAGSDTDGFLQRLDESGNVPEVGSGAVTAATVAVVVVAGAVVPRRKH